MSHDASFSIDAADLDATAAIAVGLAARLAPGTCVTLEGDLGAGKTTFVRALVTALGGDPRDVSSPTYVLLHTYATPCFAVHHLDAYRVGGADDLDAIGFGELLDRCDVVVIEWASRVSDALPNGGRIDVRISTLGPTSRRFEISATA